jgi:hypothetical protein
MELVRKETTISTYPFPFSTVDSSKKRKALFASKRKLADHRFATGRNGKSALLPQPTQAFDGPVKDPAQVRQQVPCEILGVPCFGGY